MNARYRTGIILLLLIYLIFLIRNSWASDDAFITLRVVRNILHGFGPRWNVAERVQVFTHPLWMMILIPFYVLIRNPFFTLYAACIAFSLATTSLLFYKISPASWIAPIGAALLAASKSFMDYSSSGLENPLSHFLALLFIWVFLFRKDDAKRQLLHLSLIASLSMLNRLDSTLFFLPALLLKVWQSRREFWQTSGIMLLGFAPILLWEIFSILYYGFPFPNTHYAKLTTGIPQAELYRQGWYYFQNSLAWDHITLPTIMLGTILAILRRDEKRISLALGVALYLFYILQIGGDFMSGRFFSIPYIIALALILSSPLLTNLKINPIVSVAASFLILAVGLTSFKPPILISKSDRIDEIGEHGIADEKLIYFKCCSLLNQLPKGKTLKIAEDALKAHDEGVGVVVRESIGVYGFYADPEIYIVDKTCLSDPLRARLPVTGPWRIGHFQRQYPAGYIESIQDGFENHINDPHLREYYDKLLLVTRGDLFSPERLWTILQFNLGAYDHLIDEYVQSESFIK